MVKKSNLADYASRVKEAALLKPRRIIATVSGVTFEGRQEKLKKVVPETSLKLERDRRNEFDFYAVKVMAMLDNTWEHVGFLPATMSKKISKSLDDGTPLAAGVHKVKGGFKSEHSDEVLSIGLDIFVEGNMQQY